MAGLRILTTGPLSWETGLEYALLAVAHLRHRGVDVRYDIVGSGPERDRVLYTIDDLDLSDVATLHDEGTVVTADVVLWPHLLGAPAPAHAARVVGPGLDVRDPAVLADAIRGTG